MTKKTVKKTTNKRKTAPAKQKKNRKKESILLKRIKSVFSFFKKRIALSVFIALTLPVLGYVGYCAATLPDIYQSVNRSRSAKMTILAYDGSEIASYGAKYGRPIKLKKIPAYIPQALIATEDKRFYSHFGVDFIGVFRAIAVNIVKGRKAQGASTLTQQVAKNLFLSSQKTFKRKTQEMLLSFWLEYKLTKDEILTIYLNRIYFGSGAYGIDAAARKYYGTTPRKLSLYQAASLVGLLKAPTHYNPLTQPKKSNMRARIVLANMVTEGFISAKVALNAAETGAKAEKNKKKSVYYFADWISEEANDFLGGVHQDIIVKTTLVPAMQKSLDLAIKQGLSSPEAIQKNASQAAGVVMSNNGAVLAMIGGENYQKSQFNRATQAYRQIGSAIKPFVYLTAFEQGAKPSDIVEDKPISFDGWTPKNANGKYYGQITLHDALVHSVNTVAVSLAIKTGVRKVLKTAQKFGIVNSDCEATGAIALGVCQTRLIDAVSGYASLLNTGVGITPYGVEEITTEDGEILYKRQDTSRARLINPRYIVDLDTVLIDVIQQGTGKNANPSVLAKGKTGTTQNYRDAWFLGYTQNIAAGIWVGNDDEKPMNKVTGGGLPAKIWSQTVYDISKDLEY